MPNPDQATITDYSGRETTDDPRESLEEKSSKSRTPAADLEWYEDKFPEEAFAEVSLALVGSEAIDETIEDGEAALNGETEATFDDDAQDTLERSLKLLRGLEDKQAETFKMRRYSAKTDSGPAEIEQDTSERSDHFSLFTLNAAITATADVAIYDGLETGESAIVVNQRDRRGGNGIFTVRVGKYHGNFQVFLTDDVDGLLEREFYTDRWRTAEMIRDEMDGGDGNPSNGDVDGPAESIPA